MAEYLLKSDAVQCAADLAKDFSDEGFHAEASGAYAVWEWLQDIPAADVQPVVLCRNCKHWDVDYVPNYAKENEHFCPIVTLTTRDDWFCADGEKREES